MNAGGETGFGISTGIGDNSHPVLVCDVYAQRVFTVLQKNLSQDGRLPDSLTAYVGKSFDDFIAEVPEPEPA